MSSSNVVLAALPDNIVWYALVGSAVAAFAAGVVMATLTWQSEEPNKVFKGCLWVAAGLFQQNLSA